MASSYVYCFKIALLANAQLGLESHSNYYIGYIVMVFSYTGLSHDKNGYIDEYQLKGVFDR